MDLGPFAPMSAEQRDELEQRWNEARGRPRPVIVLQSHGVTFEAATAGLSLLSCPTGHARTVPVELAATSEKVAVLCLDCDRQLPADWTTT